MTCLDELPLNRNRDYSSSKVFTPQEKQRKKRSYFTNTPGSKGFFYKKKVILLVNEVGTLLLNGKIYTFATN